MLTYAQLPSGARDTIRCAQPSSTTSTYCLAPASVPRPERRSAALRMCSSTASVAAGTTFMTVPSVTTLPERKLHSTSPNSIQSLQRILATVREKKALSRVVPEDVPRLCPSTCTPVGLPHFLEWLQNGGHLAYQSSGGALAFRGPRPLCAKTVQAAAETLGAPFDHILVCDQALPSSDILSQLISTLHPRGRLCFEVPLGSLRCSPYHQQDASSAAALLINRIHDAGMAVVAWEVLPPPSPMPAHQGVEETVVAPPLQQQHPPHGRMRLVAVISQDEHDVQDTPV